jgi:hypothetical protein
VSKVLSRNLCGGKEESQGKPNQDSRCPGRDSNLTCCPGADRLCK